MLLINATESKFKHVSDFFIETIKDAFPVFYSEKDRKNGVNFLSKSSNFTTAFLGSVAFLLPAMLSGYKVLFIIQSLYNAKIFNPFKTENIFLSIIGYAAIMSFVFALAVLIKIFYSRWQEKIELIIFNESPFKKISKIKTKNKKKNFEDFLTNQLFFTQEKMKYFSEIFEEITYRKDVGRNRAIIFFGPPGTGKTEIAKRICALLGGGWLLSMSKIVNYEEDMAIEILYKGILECQKNNKMIILDDGDIGIFDRSEMNKISNKDKTKETQKIIKTMQSCVNTILSIFGGNMSSPILFTTNTINVTDEAFSRRFDVFLHFNLPDKYQRIGIWKRYIPVVYNHSNFFDLLSEESEGLSGRDIDNICEILKYKVDEKIPCTMNEIFSEIDDYQARIASAKKESLREKREEWMNSITEGNEKQLVILKNF